MVNEKGLSEDVADQIGEYVSMQGESLSLSLCVSVAACLFSLTLSGAACLSLSFFFSLSLFTLSFSVATSLFFLLLFQSLSLCLSVFSLHTFSFSFFLSFHSVSQLLPLFLFYTT